jgi:hypothetical protein
VSGSRRPRLRSRTEPAIPEEPAADPRATAIGPDAATKPRWPTVPGRCLERRDASARRQNQGSEPPPRYYWDLPRRTARRRALSQLRDGSKALSRRGAGTPYTPTTPPLAVKVGPSARAVGAPLTGLPRLPPSALFGGGMPAPHPRRPNYANRDGQLSPEGVDRQLPASDNGLPRHECGQRRRVLTECSSCGR